MAKKLNINLIDLVEKIEYLGFIVPIIIREYLVPVPVQPMVVLVPVSRLNGMC